MEAMADADALPPPLPNRSATVANRAHRVREDAPELVEADLAREDPAPDVEQDISLRDGQADRGFGAVNHGFGSFVVARGTSRACI